MKAYILALALFASTSAFARQYFQCSSMDMNSSDVMVVNLATKDGGTLMVSPGAEYDERVVVKIKFDKVEDNKHVFKIVDETNSGSVAIPSEVVGKSVNSVNVDLAFGNYQFTFSCFARIYND